MASKTIFCLASIWLCIALFHPVRGRDAPNEEEMETKPHVRTSQGSTYSKGVNEKVSVASFLPRDNAFDPIRHWAVYKTVEDEYYGTTATINVWELPGLNAHQLSETTIYVVNGLHDDSQFNAIQVGWHVHPELYGDSRTRFFTYWTSDGYQRKGCYNLRCQGFVLQNNSRFSPGAPVEPLSNYDGKQYQMVLKIFKDSQTGDWWLHYGDEDIPLGYWPKSLFTSLANSASMIGWGGAVVYSKNITGPPMGSGHSAKEGFGKAAFFRRIQLVYKNGDLIDPLESKVHLYADKTDCYIGTTYYDGGGSEGYHFYFGGPSGCIG